jgi:hypothetical protein
MTTSQLQHYVPRFYLEAFSEGPGGVLYAYDKSSGRIFSCSPPKIAAEKSFYDLARIDEEHAAALESALSSLESEVANIFRCWHSQLAQNQLIIPLENRAIISQYISVQMLRTPEQRKILREFHRKTTGPLPSGDETADLHLHLLWNSKLVQKIADHLTTFVWVVTINRTDIPYWTSDHPVLVKDGESKHWLSGPRVFDLGVQVIFPVSPVHMLYCIEPEAWASTKEFDGSISPVPITEYMVQHENSGQVGMSTRWVFSPDRDFSFATEFCAQNPRITDPDRERFKSKGPSGE